MNLYLEGLKIPMFVTTDKYKGYQYYILTMGTHPTAYVNVPKESKYYGKFYLDIDDIVVHGGLTYSDDNLRTNEGRFEGGWYIGWDYNHWGDFNVLLLHFGSSHCEKKWTVEEITEDCRSVIDQIIENERSGQ